MEKIVGNGRSHESDRGMPVRMRGRAAGQSPDRFHTARQPGAGTVSGTIPGGARERQGHIPAGRAGGTYHSHAGRRSGFPGRQSSYMGGDPETHQH